MKVYVHVNNNDYLFDKRVSIEINLPFVPIVGDNIILKDEERNRLLEMCKTYIDDYRNYIDDKQNSISENPNPDLMDMSTSCTVRYKRYDRNTKLFHIDVSC